MPRPPAKPPADKSKVTAVVGPKFDKARGWMLRWKDDGKNRTRGSFETAEAARAWRVEHLDAVPPPAPDKPIELDARPTRAGDAHRQVMLAEAVQARAIKFLPNASTIEEVGKISNIVSAMAGVIRSHRDQRETEDRLEQLEQAMNVETKARKNGRRNQRTAIPQARIVRRGEEPAN